MSDLPVRPTAEDLLTPSTALVADVARVLHELPTTTPEQRFEAAAWAALLQVEGPRLLTRASLLAHVTASTVVLNRDATRTCLVLHGRFGRWVQAGGHVEDGDDTLAAAAQRELWEETGLRGDILPATFLSRHLAPCRPEVDYHLDFQFVVVTDDVEPVVSAESRDVRWWPVDALPDGLADRWEETLAFALAAFHAPSR